MTLGSVVAVSGFFGSKSITCFTLTWETSTSLLRALRLFIKSSIICLFLVEWWCWCSTTKESAMGEAMTHQEISLRCLFLIPYKHPTVRPLWIFRRVPSPPSKAIGSIGLSLTKKTQMPRAPQQLWHVPLLLQHVKEFLPNCCLIPTLALLVTWVISDFLNCFTFHFSKLYQLLSNCYSLQLNEGMINL